MPDTDCMIASVTPRHPSHALAAAELVGRTEFGEQMLIAAPTLVETYSVLTRLPLPQRLTPVDGLAVIDSFIQRAALVVALDAAGYIELLRGAPIRGVTGGRTYDAVIAACARLAGVERFVTFNARHFLRLLEPDVRVVVPGELRGR